MNLYPFSPERQIGVIYQVEGSFADVAFNAATKLPRSHYSEYLGRGEVGEFVVINIGGVAAFGRILRVGSMNANFDRLTKQDSRVTVEGRIQLLSTLHPDGKATRGILKYPKVGDPVYAASSETIQSILKSGASDDNKQLTLGHLTVDGSVKVSVPLTRLFGRHLAVVGATGSGKSWTLGLLAEEVGKLSGMMVLIDATGEFQTLSTNTKHLAFGSLDGEPTGTTRVSLPHYLMRESDLCAFINPSSGTQLPKLRAAIRSLRLAHAIRTAKRPTKDHQAIVGAEGLIRKEGKSRAAFERVNMDYENVMNDSHAPFDLMLLARQIELECVWPTGRNGSDCYGASDHTQIGYVSTLVSRIHDLVQTPEIMRVIQNSDETHDESDKTHDVLEEIEDWFTDKSKQVLRISLRNVTFANHLREIIVNILGQDLLARARNGRFKEIPLVVAIDEAHQFFDTVVGDEFSSTRLNAFDSIAKEGRKYGLTVCLATQRPGDLPAGVLSQVGMTIVHRLADGRDRQRVEQAAAELDHSATRLLPGLVPGEAILMGVDFPVPVSVRIQAPVAPPASDGPQYENWRER